MDLREFADQLEQSSQTPEEIRQFVADFALVRLRHITRRLKEMETTADPVFMPDQSAVNWTDRTMLNESGIDPSWLSEGASSDNLYLSLQTVSSGDWKCISSFLDLTFLSDKQRRIVFPILSKGNRPKTILGNKVTADTFSGEVQRLNVMLFSAAEAGMTRELFGKYFAHLNIHGGSQNVSGNIGSIGAIITVMDSLKETAAGRIADVLGDELPEDKQTPLQIYNYINDDKITKVPKAVLLDNGRSIVFASDPDVAIFQSLGAAYKSAKEAFQAWQEVRRDVAGRREKVHQFAVGEVKTATDLQNLHERLALGSRETKDEVRTDRFLLMAVLTPELLSENPGRKRRKGTGLANKDVARFSDVFNLHHAWGYDGGRSRHPEHWARFKSRLRHWCGV